MLSDPVTKAGSGLAGPAPQAATLLNYAKTCRSEPAKPSVDVFGQVRSQCGLRIEEVSLERTRVSRQCHSHLDYALSFCYFATRLSLRGFSVDQFMNNGRWRVQSSLECAKGGNVSPGSY